jgi:23S rRNA (uridine2552-2'-O)-methyltransferase
MYQPQDFFFNKAKKEGYPARSVYKLSEIDKKFKLFYPGQNILDLGCSPGSWSIYVIEKIKPNGVIMGIDLKRMESISHNFIFKQANIMEMTDQELISFMDQNQFGPKIDGLISDMAPSTSGVRMLDAGRSAKLAERVLSLAQKFLKKKGFLVLKILEGGEHDHIWQEIKKSFKKSKQIRPRAVRRNSREIYIVAHGFKGN